MIRWRVWRTVYIGTWAQFLCPTPYCTQSIWDVHRGICLRDKFILHSNPRSGKILTRYTNTVVTFMWLDVNIISMRKRWRVWPAVYIGTWAQFLCSTPYCTWSIGDVHRGICLRDVKTIVLLLLEHVFRKLMISSSCSTTLSFIVLLEANRSLFQKLYLHGFSTMGEKMPLISMCMLNLLTQVE